MSTTQTDRRTNKYLREHIDWLIKQVELGEMKAGQAMVKLKNLNVPSDIIERTVWRTQ